jgi:hypothetical protein
MPTDDALGITATLSLADFQSSLTSGIFLRQGEEQRRDHERVEQAFDNGEKLREHSIPQQETGLAEDIPFFMVGVTQRQRRHQAAQALCLTIEASKKSLHPPDRGPTGAGGRDLKIEIFYNGDLAAVAFLHHRVPHNNKLRFHGTRVHRQVEKPWVSEHSDVQLGGSTERWAAINALLGDEAKLRGANQCGKTPPSADFLATLSQMELPSPFQDNAGIGIIDMIITVGTGRKFGPETAYLMAPTRLIDEEYRFAMLPHSVSSRSFEPLLMLRQCEEKRQQ